MPDETVQTGLSDNAASGLAYVTFIPAIIFLVVAPYNQNAKIRFHCWQSIFLGIACVVGARYRACLYPLSSDGSRCFRFGDLHHLDRLHREGVSRRETLHRFPSLADLP